MARRKPSPIGERVKEARRVDRAIRASSDPWFGKRRPTSFPDQKKEADRNACRRKDTWQ